MVVWWMLPTLHYLSSAYSNPADEDNQLEAEFTVSDFLMYLQ